MITLSSHDPGLNGKGRYRLTDGVGVTAFDGFVLVLDVRNDRYCRLGGGAAAMLSSLQAGGTIADDARSTDMLEAKGLITRDPAPVSKSWIAPGVIPRPSTSLLETGAAPAATFADVADMMWGCTATRLRLRVQSLHHILVGLPAIPARRPAKGLVALAHALDRARRISPFKPRCLPDAIAFVRRSRRQGHVVHLVFGVKAYPFEAHCWAQADETVLTDPLDRVLRFEPILAL